jgi:hypothetical protein
MIRYTETAAKMFARITKVSHIQLMSMTEKIANVVALIKYLLPFFIRCLRFLIILQIDLINCSTCWTNNCLAIIIYFINLLSAIFTNLMLTIVKCDRWVVYKAKLFAT